MNVRDEDGRLPILVGVPSTMRAVAYETSLPIEDPASLIDVVVDVPHPGPNDLLVRVEAISVNPVDTKVRLGNDPGGTPKVLGYDASGTVVAVGDAVTRFAPGDDVFYAGSIARPGTNAEFHVVDERITGHKPVSLGFGEAAALPLTAITAWETLFDRLALSPTSSGTLLVLAGAGGVGSVLIQLARTIPGITVVATASRPESREWALALGAHEVVDYRDGLVEAVLGVAPDGVDYVFSPYSEGNVESFAEIVRPGGHVVAIDEPPGLDLLALKAKSIAWHWELMFTRPLFEPEDPAQHEILERVAALVDAGTLRSTMTVELGPINAENLREAHRRLESGATVGKVVLTGFGEGPRA
jgi:zinc-binding alcohol dehydrogenase family protein